MAVDESLDDATWTARCTAKMVALDPLLEPDLARPIAEDMCTRARWRAMAPEVAAQTVFDFGSKRGPAPV